MLVLTPLANNSLQLNEIKKFDFDVVIVDCKSVTSDTVVAIYGPKYVLGS